MNRTLPTSVLFLSVFLTIAMPAWAGEFSADFKQFHGWEDEGKKERTGKIFVKADRSRMEFAEGGKAIGIMIVNPQKNAAWMLDPAEKTYMEIPFSEELWRMAKSAEPNHPDLKQTRLGQETVGGYLCDRIRFTYRDASLGHTVVWLSKKLEYPVKWETKTPNGDAWFQLANIVEGKQRDSLFEVPAGFKAMSMETQHEAEEESEVAEEVKKDVKDIGDDARGAAKQGISDGVTDSIRKGIEGLFRR